MDETKPEYLCVKDARELLYEITNVQHSRPTIYNWMNMGIKSDTEDRIKLQYITITNQRFTTEQWIREFLEKVENECS